MLGKRNHNAHTHSMLDYQYWMSLKQVNKYNIVGNPFCLKPDKILALHIPRACRSQNLVQQTKKLFFDWQSKLIEKLHLMYQIIEQ